jgi:hypothetical protein
VKPSNTGVVGLTGEAVCVFMHEVLHARVHVSIP